MDEIGKLASNDSDAFGKVVNYITNSAKDHTTVDAASDILMDIEQIIEPGISENVAYDKVAGYKGMK